MDPVVLSIHRPAGALSREAWGELYERFSRYVLAILRRYVSPADLDDVAHDYWCHVREKFSESFQNGDVKAWLATTAYRKGLDWVKRKRPQRMAEGHDVADSASGSLLEGLVRTEEENSRAAALAKCLEKLNDAERSLLSDRIAGKKSAQIAADRGVTAAQESKSFFTIKTRLQDCVGRSLQ